MKIILEMESPFCRQFIKDLKLGSNAVPKLIPSFLDKSNYVVHYWNLELYLVLGIAFVNAVFLHS